MNVTVTVSPEDRIAGLLDANNRYLNRARAAEAKVNVALDALDRIADAARQDQSESPLQTIIEIAADVTADIGVEHRWNGVLTRLMGLADVLDEVFEESVITKEGTPLVVAALARVFPERVQTRETCSCGAADSCDECPSAADMLALDRKLSSHFASLAANV